MSEPLAGREGSPGVDHPREKAKEARETHERDRHVDRSHHQQLRGRRVDLEEDVDLLFIVTKELATRLEVDRDLLGVECRSLVEPRRAEVAQGLTPGPDQQLSSPTLPGHHRRQHHQLIPAQAVAQLTKNLGLHGAHPFGSSSSASTKTSISPPQLNPTAHA